MSLDAIVIIIAIVSTIFFAFSSIYGKYLIKELSSSYYFFLFQLIVNFMLLSGLMLILTLLNMITISGLTHENLLLIIYSSIFNFIGFVSLFQGFEVGNVSVGGVYLSSRVFISIPIAILILGEQYQVIIYFWIFITLIGALLVSWQKSLSISQFLSLQGSGANWFVVTLLSWAISNSFVRQLNNEVPTILFLFIRLILLLILGLFSYPVLKPLLAKHVNFLYSTRLLKHTSVYVIVLLFAQIGFVYALGISLAITEGIGVLEGVFTFVLVISLSRIKMIRSFLDEPLDRISLSVRSIGVIFAMLGTIGILLEFV